MTSYRIAIEVSGPLAMWARPDTGGAPTSYPAPTWSAAKGLLESVAFFSTGEAWLHPTRVEICRRHETKGGEIQFQRYATNYNGPLRKEQNVKNNTPMQFSRPYSPMSATESMPKYAANVLGGDVTRGTIFRNYSSGELSKVAAFVRRRSVGASSPVTIGGRSAIHGKWMTDSCWRFPRCLIASGIGRTTAPISRASAKVCVSRRVC